ncbi:MAG: ATP-binding protein, partial [Promethearchaeota archaeon]
NESGKTLTIDALLKILNGRDNSQFKNLNRVEEKPEGYIIISDHKGKDVKLKGPKNINNIIDLSSTEFNNLFIIRDSDLALFNEDDLYNSITDRLLGLRIKDVELIINNLRDIGKLTAGGKFSNVKPEKFDDKINGASDCIQLIKQLSEKIENKQFDKIEEELFLFEKKLEKADNEIENYEDARKREIYEKGSKALKELNESTEKVKNLMIFSESDKEAWRDYEKELSRCSKNKEELLINLEEYRTNLMEKNEILKKKELQFQIPDTENKVLENDIIPELKTYEIKRGEIAGQAERSKFFTDILIISTFLLGISLLGGMIGSLILGYILAALFAILTLGTVVYKLIYLKNKAFLEGFTERLNLKLLKIGLESKNMQEVYSNIQKFENKYTIEKTDLENLRRSVEKLEEKIKDLREKEIPEIVEKIEKFNNKISDLGKKSMVRTISEYEEKLQLKQINTRNFNTQQSILRSLLGIEGESDEDYIIYWTSELKSLEKYESKGLGLTYKEEIIYELKKKKSQLQENLRTLNDIMTELRGDFKEIETKVNNILQIEDDYIYCTTSNDLEKVREKLNEFLIHNYIKRDRILDIIDIFSEIKTQEKEKISKLLSKKSNVSEYFKEVTNGVYTSVIFEMETGKIKVIRKDDQIFDIEQISGGTYDQLYFTIRLALGEQILQDKTGFFILDDPFVKADSERLKRQIEMLKKICQFGWQVLYFTSKDEIVDTLKADIRSGKINYVELESLIN